MAVKKANKKEVKRKPKRKTVSRKMTSARPKKEYALKLLEQLEGIGEGIWREDAQKYVNRLRDNDRR